MPRMLELRRSNDDSVTLVVMCGTTGDSLIYKCYSPIPIITIIEEYVKYSTMT